MTPRISSSGLRRCRTSAISFRASFSPDRDKGCGNTESKNQSALLYAATVVVAPAEGSRSITRQRYPRSPRAAATCTALVVFPTPPFWFPTAITVLSLRPIVFSLHGVTINGCYWHASHHACTHIIQNKS